jgi:hypothetical protein
VTFTFQEGIDLIKVELKSDEEGHHYPIEKFKGITLPVRHK